MHGKLALPYMRRWSKCASLGIFHTRKCVVRDDSLRLHTWTGETNQCHGRSIFRFVKMNAANRQLLIMRPRDVIGWDRQECSPESGPGPQDI